MKKNKKHFIQRWYEKTPEERIHTSWILVAFIFIMFITLWIILTTTVNIECTTGDLKIYADFNSSMNIKNLSFYGVNGMACHINMPAYIVMFT